ncbi:MAG TPA: hypothetical protein VE959_20195 [Bryobacteraceae bacterium]|nr:hypothetical protein [Bryobacteraceae bacterium]
MTTTRRERGNAKWLEKIKKHWRRNLQILRHTSRSDKEEIEDRVMARMHEAVISVSDFTIEHGGMLPAFESDADSLAMDILMAVGMAHLTGNRLLAVPAPAR